MTKELKTSKHKSRLRKYIWKNVKVPWDQNSHHEIGHKCTNNNPWRRTLKIEDMYKYHLWDLWMKNMEHKLVCNNPTKKMVFGAKTCEEQYELWIYVQNSRKEFIICALKPTKINCGKQHTDTNHNLNKM